MPIPAMLTFFLSPLSVSFARGMTSDGSNGQTLTAINNPMNFNGFSQQQVNSYYHKLITTLPQLDQNTTINIANSISYNQGFSVLPQFLQTNKSYYHANIQAIDFNSPTATNTINNWVSNQTNGKIRLLLTWYHQARLCTLLMLYILKAPGKIDLM